MAAELPTVDYSNMKRDELITICKETGIKGYSGKKKNVILSLLSESNEKKNHVIASVLELNKNTSPLRYPGGKTRAITILYEYIQTYYPQRKIVLSPFFGGGSFELFLSVNGYTVYGNDLFRPLYNFWTVKQTNCKTLTTKIKENIPISKEKFYQLRNTIMKEHDSLEMAVSYFIINRTSFSGATLSGGFSEQASKGRLTESSLHRLLDCNVDAITFSNLDCNAFLDNYPETHDTVLYADPPYYINKYIYGKDGDMHENFNHIAFAETIRKRNDWIISYNDCEYIRDLYKGCRIFNTHWSYGMNKNKKSSEIIILPPA